MKGIEHPTDLIGLKVGHLTVTEFSYRDNHSRQYWKCFCDACGNYKDILRPNLLKGKIRSCGCQQNSYVKRKINTYDLSGEYGIGYTSKGEEFHFDLEDYDKIKDSNWCVDSNGYITTSAPKRMKMHRLIMNVDDPNIEVDHIYHNRRDNRKSQLRLVSSTQNQMNKTPQRHSSPCTGVSWHKNKHFRIVQIGLNGKLKYVGCSKDLDEAIQMRKDAEKKYFGEYAYKELEKTEAV